NPSSQTVNEGSTTKFIITPPGCNYIGYQWQVDTGAGFIDIVKGGKYSKVNDTLIINSIPHNFHNYKYRCIIKGINPYVGSMSPYCYLDTTTYATLTVIPTGVNEVNTNYQLRTSYSLK